MAIGKWQINLANFTIHSGQISSAQNIGEIERRIFHQKSDFLLGTQRLVKLTPGVGWSDEVDQG